MSLPARARRPVSLRQSSSTLQYIKQVFLSCIRCPVPFLQNTFLETLLGVALHAAQLEHRDANASVMKFLTELIRCGSADPEKMGENEAEGKWLTVCLSASVSLCPSVSLCLSVLSV